MNVFVLAEQTKTVQSMSSSSCAPAHPFCSPVRLFKTRAVKILPMNFGEMLRVCVALLLAAVTDHGQIRDRHMSVLGIVFIHAVLLHLPLGIFLHPVGCGIRHYTGNLDRMPDVFVEFDSVALDLLGAASLRGKIVLIGIVAFLKTARKRPRFLVGGLCCFLCRSQAGHAGKHEQRNYRRHDLEIRHSPSKS
jgi:hypothetical protein